MHEHFDEDNVRTGYTVITREAEWDADTRGRALRLIEWEDSKCGCGCGQPVSKSLDKTLPWMVDTFTCYAGRALDRVRRNAADLAETQKRPTGWDDGLHYYVEPAKESEIDPRRRSPRELRGGRGN